jgi:hypothetical protein
MAFNDRPSFVRRQGGAARKRAPQESNSDRGPEPGRCPPLARGGLFRRCDLFNPRSSDCSFALLIGLVQEPVNEVSASLFLDPPLLRFLLFSEELVIYFPAHGFLHSRDGINA